MQRESDSPDTSCCKVGRLLGEYDLGEFAAELAERWGEPDGESASLRELQREFNRGLLRTRLTEHGVSPVDGEVENLRRLLNGENTPESRRIEARSRLETEGIDVDDLLSDFVSHQSIYNHLRDCEDVSKGGESSTDDRISRAESTIYGLQSRTELVTEQTLSQLGSTAELDPAEYDVVVTIQTICEACGRSQSIEALLSNGGCQCGGSIGANGE